MRIPETETSTIPYQPWIDWLKFLAMVLILGGHSGMDDLIGPRFNPINPKQLGVAFFVLITGYTLAQGLRSSLETVIRRYTPVLIYGLLIAIAFSFVGWLVRRDLGESNYLPFLFGLNTFWENAFPANPSTWYIGTYLQLLVVWAVLLNRLRASWLLFFVLTAIEIVIRALWMSNQRDFNAYMSVTSWLPMLMAGMILGQENSASPNSPHSGSLHRLLQQPWLAPVAAVSLVVFLLAWSRLVESCGITKSNPFGRIPISNGTMSCILTSAAVSLQYGFYTAATLALVYPLPCPRWIRFLSRHTLWVFLAHMPVRDVLTPLYYPWFKPDWFRQLANFLVLFVGLAWVSEAMSRWLKLPSFCKVVEARLLQLGRWASRALLRFHGKPD